MPHASTLIRTSPAAGCGISRSSSSNSPPAFPTCATRFFAISLSPSQSLSGSGFWMPSLPPQLEIQLLLFPSCSSHFLAPTSRTVPSANSNLNPGECYGRHPPPSSQVRPNCVWHAFPWSPTSSKNAVLFTPTPSSPDFLKRAHEVENSSNTLKTWLKADPLGLPRRASFRRSETQRKPASSRLRNQFPFSNLRFTHFPCPNSGPPSSCLSPPPRPKLFLMMSSFLRRISFSLLTFFVLSSLDACSSASSSTTSNPPPPSGDSVAISVTPTSASIRAGASLTFSARVSHSANTTVSWSVNSTPGGSSALGTVDSSGNYTAPTTLPSPNTISITATSAADK